MVRHIRAILFSLLGFSALFGLSALLAPSQTDNTIYVKQFPGTTVAAKLTAAMATCPPSTAGPCILVIDPSLAVYAQGTLPSLCGSCVLADYRTGLPSALPAGLVSDGKSGLKVSGVLNQFQGYGAVFCCDSRTSIGNPAGNGLNPGQEYPAQLQAMSVGAGMASWNNVAVSGSKCADWDSIAGNGTNYYTTYIHPLRPSVVGHPQLLFVWCGVNDLSAGGSTGAQTLAWMQDIWSEAKTDGFTVIAFNECQGGTYSINSASIVTLREGIAASAGDYDYLFDVFAFFRDTTDSTFWNTSQSPVYHMNATGAHQLAFLVNNMLTSRSTQPAMQTTTTPPLNWIYWNTPNVKCGLEGIFSASEIGCDNGIAGSPPWTLYGYKLDSTHYIRLKFYDSGSSWTLGEDVSNETAIPMYVGTGAPQLYLNGSTNYTGAHFYPSTDAARDLGAHPNRFRSLYLSNGVGTVALSGGTATVTFASAFGAAPICTATDTTAAAAVRVSSVSTTGFTITGTGTDTVSYICIGN